MLCGLQFFLYGLLVFVTSRCARAFNETCGPTTQPCDEPLKCINGFCLCSQIAKSTDQNHPLAFWANGDCHPCPLDYTTTGTKCYNLVLTKGSQLTWDRARERCKETSGDLLVFRSTEEYLSMAARVKSNLKDVEVPQRAPHDGKHFGSIWIGGKLSDWRGDGTFNFVSHGASLTKKNPNWCPQSSPLGLEPNYVQLKATGERQACVGLAFFPDNSVCMHDWFCTWDSYTLCEIHPPAPPTATETAEALAGSSSSAMLYVIVGVVVVIVIVLVATLVACYCLCKKKKKSRRTRSFDSTATDMTRNSLY